MLDIGHDDADGGLSGQGRGSTSWAGHIAEFVYCCADAFFQSLRDAVGIVQIIRDSAQRDSGFLGDVCNAHLASA